MIELFWKHLCILIWLNVWSCDVVLIPLEDWNILMGMSQNDVNITVFKPLHKFKKVANQSLTVTYILIWLNVWSCDVILILLVETFLLKRRWTVDVNSHQNISFWYFYNVIICQSLEVWHKFFKFMWMPLYFHHHHYYKYCHLNAFLRSSSRDVLPFFFGPHYPVSWPLSLFRRQGVDVKTCFLCHAISQS